MQQGQLLADAVAGHVAEHRQRLRDAVQQIEDRIEDPDITSSLELVARLEPVDRTGRAVRDDLMDLSASATSVAAADSSRE